jgi:hypothetical protein
VEQPDLNENTRQDTKIDHKSRFYKVLNQKKEARVPRLRVSPGHGRTENFSDFVTTPPRGRPFGGGGVHRYF